MASRDTRVTVDSSAITENARAIKAYIGHAKLMAVVKADGYGHGIKIAAYAALSGGAESLAVATVEEGLLLRSLGVTARILVLGSLTEGSVQEAVREGLTLTIYHLDNLPWLQRAAERLQKSVFAHIQVETGMRRLGVLPAELPTLLNELSACHGIEVNGVFSHFADPSDMPFTARQLKDFLSSARIAQISQGSLERHIASSGTALSRSETHLDMVRCGIALYGYPPCETAVNLRPALRVTTSIVQLQVVPAGESVGYGRTWIVPRKSVIAVLPIGYGDGYGRCIGNRGFALIHGQRAPVVGRVCMDLCMLDVTDIPQVVSGDEVVLMGEQGEDRVTADDWAVWCDTIPYEVLLRLTARMPRIIIG